MKTPHSVVKDVTPYGCNNDGCYCIFSRNFQQGAVRGEGGGVGGEGAEERRRDDSTASVVLSL